MRRALLPGVAIVVLGVLSSTTALASSQPARLTVLHGLPHFTADIYVNGRRVLDGFKPQSVTAPLPLPPGVYHLAIRPVGKPATSPPVLSRTVKLEAGGNYTVAAHLTPSGSPALSVFEDRSGRLPPGRSKLVVRPLATLPAIDVESNGQTLFRHVPAGHESAKRLNPGTYSVQVLAAAQRPVLHPQQLRVVEGKAYFLYVIGSQKDGTLALMVQSFSASAGTPSTIQSGTGGLLSTGPPPSVRAVFLTAAVVASLALIVLFWQTPSRRPISRHHINRLE